MLQGAAKKAKKKKHTHTKTWALPSNSSSSPRLSRLPTTVARLEKHIYSSHHRYGFPVNPGEALTLFCLHQGAPAGGGSHVQVQGRVSQGQPAWQNSLQISWKLTASPGLTQPWVLVSVSAPLPPLNACECSDITHRRTQMFIMPPTQNPKMGDYPNIERFRIKAAKKKKSTSSIPLRWIWKAFMYKMLSCISPSPCFCSSH